MRINAIQCLKCEDIIFSRTTHDFRSCTCGTCFIDGGFDYTRVGCKDTNDYKHVELDLEISVEELRQDWNKKIDKYGLIKK